MSFDSGFYAYGLLELLLKNGEIPSSFTLDTQKLYILRLMTATTLCAIYMPEEARKHGIAKFGQEDHKVNTKQSTEVSVNATNTPLGSKYSVCFNQGLSSLLTRLQFKLGSGEDTPDILNWKKEQAAWASNEEESLQIQATLLELVDRPSESVVLFYEGGNGGKHAISAKSLASLCSDDGWLSDEIITAWSAHLEDVLDLQSTQCGEDKRILALTSFFYSKLKQLSIDWQRVDRWFAVRILSFPVNKWP